MAIIQQLSDNSYTVQARGSRMILERTKRGWRVRTQNAASRVWSMGGESWKEFDTLAEVEANYKSWKGIGALIGTPEQQAQ